MADSTVNQQNGGNGFDVGSSIFHTLDTGIVAYFGAQTAQKLAHAPLQNTAVVVGGIVVIGIIAFMILKR